MRAEGFEGAIGADWALGAEGAMGAEEDKGASIYTLLDGQDTIGIRYMALRGFGANCRVMDGWVSGWIPLRLLRLLEHLRC